MITCAIYRLSDYISSLFLLFFAAYKTMSTTAVARRPETVPEKQPTRRKWE
jgi:hypothetical protein